MKYLLTLLILLLPASALAETPNCPVGGANNTGAVQCCLKYPGYHMNSSQLCLPDDPTPCPYVDNLPTSDPDCVAPEPKPEPTPVPTQTQNGTPPQKKFTPPQTETYTAPTPQTEPTPTPKPDVIDPVDNNGGNQLDTLNPQQVGTNLSQLNQ